MKGSILILAILFFTLTSCAQDETLIELECASLTPIEVYFVGGQSNATDLLAKGLKDAIYWNGHDSSKYVVIQKRHPGKSISNWSDGNYTDQDISYIESVMAQRGIENWHLNTILWFQGESDTYLDEDVLNFKKRSVAVLNRFKSEIGDTDTKIVVALIWSDQTKTQDVNYVGQCRIDFIRRFQNEVASEVGGMIHDTQWYLRWDFWHLTNYYYKKMGLDIANLIE